MLYRSVLLYFLFVSSIVQAAHFRGGYLSWQPVLPNATNDSMVTINIQQTYSWTYTRYNCGSLVGDSGSLVCVSSNCSNYVSSMTQIQAPCISFDIALDVSTGQSVTPVTLFAGSQLILKYQSNAWLPLVQIPASSYSLVMSIDLRVRSDIGLINSSPTSSMIALVTIPVGVQQVLRIPMADINLDVVKCRWANKTSLIGNTIIDECQGVCQNIPGAQLYTSSYGINNCSLLFTTMLAGYYVVTLQIEDFMPTAPNGTALSSIPLQFLVRTLNVSCNQPNITGQIASGSIVQVLANTIFSVTIIAQTDCDNSTISRFLTISSPSGIENTTAMASLNAQLHFITFVWTPTIDQIDSTHLLCTLAVDTNGLQSREYCLDLIVVSSITNTTTGSSTSVITSTTTEAPTDNQSLDLGLILGLAIPLLLFASILGTCIACRWHSGELCKNLRHRFWDENLSYKQKQNVRIQQSSKNSNINESSKRYRQQYINERPTTLNETSYVNSFSSNSILFSGNNSVATIRNSLLSPYTNSSLPGIETPTSITNPFQSLYANQSGSILVNAYCQQETQHNSPV